MQEREGEKSLVAFFGEELLFELDKIGFEVDHFWGAAVSSGQKRQQSFHQREPHFDKEFTKQSHLRLYHFHFYTVMMQTGAVSLQASLTSSIPLAPWEAVGPTRCTAT